MGLCSAIECGCALTSSTLPVTGDGSPADPWDIGGGDVVETVLNFTDLPDPAAMPDGATRFVTSAGALCLVVDGKYMMPGQHYYRVTGTVSPTAISGTITCTFDATAIDPVAPVTFALGDFSLNPFFHPAQVSVLGFGRISKSLSLKVDTVTLTIAGDVNPYVFRSETEQWFASADTTQIIPILGVVEPIDSVSPHRPVASGASPTSISFVARSFSATLPNPCYLWIRLDWNIVQS